MLADVHTAYLQPKNGEIYDKKPFKVLLEKDKKYYWCLCGQGHNQVSLNILQFPYTSMQKLRNILNEVLIPNMIIKLCNVVNIAVIFMYLEERSAVHTNKNTNTHNLLQRCYLFR